MNTELDNKILYNCISCDPNNSKWRILSVILVYDVKNPIFTPLEKHLNNTNLLYQFKHYNKLKFSDIYTIPNYNRLYVYFIFETEPNLFNYNKFLLQDFE